MSILETVQKLLMAGLGMQEKVKEFIDELVKKGELSETQGAKIVKEWSKSAGETKEEFDKNLVDLINKAFEKVNIPTKDEMDELKKKLQSLSVRVKKLEESSPVKEK